MNSYQSFDSSGVSDSVAKLRAIKLPEDLAGKSFLDIGCNEGFFCIEAKRRGAARVVGIDRSSEFIARARERDPEIDFREQTWDELPDEKFDVIIMLSALHYEERPRELLRRIRDHLTEDGLFILEVGISSRRGVYRVWTQRKSVVYHPTWGMLERYLEPFAYRVVGRSVDQPGDPVPRWVIHCRPRKANVLLVTGRSQYGKSTLARQIGEGRRVVVEVDEVIRRIMDSMVRVDGRLLEVIKEFKDANIRSFSQIIEGIVEAGAADTFARVLVDHIPLDEDLVVVEGYGLRDSVLEGVLRRLEGQAFTWVCETIPAADARGRFPREGPEQIEQLRSQVARLERKAAQSGQLEKELRDAIAENARLNQRLNEANRKLAVLSDRLSRLRNRTSVRAALRFADVARPFIQLLRRSGD